MINNKMGKHFRNSTRRNDKIKDWEFNNFIKIFGLFTYLLLFNKDLNLEPFG